MIFDSHAHYDDEAFAEDRDTLLTGMAAAGISHIVNVGASLSGIEATVQLAGKYPFVYAALGVHPDEAGSLDDDRLAWIKGLCSHEKTVAVGEIGLDYYWDKENHDRQKEWFVRQLELAKEVDLPVVIHSRDAAQDTLDIMRSEHRGTTGGVIHCFSGSREIAAEYLKMGYYLGIGGVITFKNARVLKEVVAYAPLDQLLVETDCPYLAPTPYRGKRNSSLLIPYILEAIAGIKGVSREEAEAITWENAMKMYQIPKQQ